MDGFPGCPNYQSLAKISVKLLLKIADEEDTVITCLMRMARVVVHRVISSKTAKAMLSVCCSLKAESEVVIQTV